MQVLLLKISLGNGDIARLGNVRDGHFIGRSKDRFDFVTDGDHPAISGSPSTGIGDLAAHNCEGSFSSPIPNLLFDDRV